MLWEVLALKAVQLVKQFEELFLLGVFRVFH